MPLETVTVIAGGGAYTLWSEISIQYGAEQAVRTATLVCADPAATFGGGAFPLMPDVEVQLLAGGEAVLTGYVRDVRPAFGDQDHSVQVGLVSKTVDLVEASIDHPTGRAEKKTLAQLIEEFDTAGLTVRNLAELDEEEMHQINPGESPFSTVEPLARGRGVLIYDDGDGNVVTATAPEGRHAGGLQQGVNLTSGTATLTGRPRFDPVIVRGQAARGTGETALRIEAKASDSGVGRKRPKVIVAEFDATTDRLKKRAEWQVRRAAGRSRQAEVSVPGWRDQAGTLWMPNHLVWLGAPLLYLEQDMAIASVTLTQNDFGTSARLAVVDPRALGGEDPQGSSGETWSVPEASAEVGAS